MEIFNSLTSNVKISANLNCHSGCKLTSGSSMIKKLSFFNLRLDSNNCITHICLMPDAVLCISQGPE